MCFSASVSYGSAALLIATGAATTVGNRSKPLRMVAAIPLLFGAQQAAEGIVWQTVGQEPVGPLGQFGILIFLTFALVVWPSWLPWSIYKIENNEKRKRILKIIGVVGLGVSLLAASVLYRVKVHAFVTGHSLGYSFLNVNASWPANIEFLLYVIPTLIPFFISSLRMVKRTGYLVVGSMVISQFINQEATTSVWCFFAALISLYVAVNILWVQKRQIG